MKVMSDAELSGLLKAPESDRVERRCPFDIKGISSATLDNIDRLRFEQEYLPALVAKDVLEANDRTLVQKLAASKLIRSESEPVPTVLGLLVCGKRPADWIPGAYTQFLRIGGRDLADPVLDEAVIHGTVRDQIRRLEEKVDAHNRRRVEFSASRVEQIHEEYSVEGLRQLIRNAYMHRSFESTHAPVRLYWFDDRIEIHSPGGPFGSVSVENFGEPGLTDYRNPNLAEALRALGYVQRLGAGLVIARRHFGARLQFRVQASNVVAVIRRGV